jgi:hypothetical protein
MIITFLRTFRRVKAMIEKQKQSDAAMNAINQGEDSTLFLFLEYYQNHLLISDNALDYTMSPYMARAALASPTARGSYDSGRIFI